MHQNTMNRSVVRVMADSLFLPIVLIYALAAAAFGCSGSLSISGSTHDPNRAHGVYRTSEVFNEAKSRAFFGYWLNGDNDITWAEARALQTSIGLIRNTATVTIVPGSILYEEQAVEIGTGRTITIAISGTWSYQGGTRMRVNWGSAFVTQSTFPTTPPYHVAISGTRIEGPQNNDIIFANRNWTTLRNIRPGPLDNAVSRIN